MLRWLFGRCRSEARESTNARAGQDIPVRDPNAVTRASPTNKSSPSPVAEPAGNAISSIGSPVADSEYGMTGTAPPVGQTVVIVHNRTEKEAMVVRAQAGGRRLFVQQNNQPVRVFARTADLYCLEGARRESAPVLQFQTH